MAKNEDEDRWLEGRTRHVRVYLTDEEHALVRHAAALADKSVSRFSIEAIVKEAGQIVATPKTPSADAPPAATAKPASGKATGKKREKRKE